MRITIETIYSDKETVSFTIYPNGERVIVVSTNKQKATLDKIYELLRLTLSDDERP